MSADLLVAVEPTNVIRLLLPSVVHDRQAPVWATVA
jgi:hypothetical protein